MSIVISVVVNLDTTVALRYKMREYLIPDDWYEGLSIAQSKRATSHDILKSQKTANSCRRISSTFGVMALEFGL